MPVRRRWSVHVHGGGLLDFRTPCRYPRTSDPRHAFQAELDYLPSQRIKLSAQLTAYTKFNGARTNYDGFGRNASDNDSL